MRQAVAGIGTSGVTVAQMMRSMSCGRDAGHLERVLRAPSWANSETDSSGLAIRRSRIPVRVWIHSSLVSTSFSRS